ncbi:MAG: DUF2782 domain-containing protein [Dokdonella sp.]
MARIVGLLMFSLAASVALAAQPSARDPLPPALPPPAFDDKGVAATAPPSTSSTIEPAAPDTRLVRDKAARDPDMESIRASSDDVKRRREGADTVEEYRENGRLRMIRIISQNGPDKFYIDRDSDGRLERDPGDGPASPVYFTIYEWN